MTPMDDPFQLSNSQQETVYALGELILGVPQEELGQQFLDEATAFIANLDDFLIGDLTRLLNLFNSRWIALTRILRFKRFVDMDDDTKARYFQSWVYSKIPLLRTAAASLRALCGWSYYSLEAEWEEMNYPGKTLGREDETPTLLEGKQAWEPGLEVDRL